MSVSPSSNFVTFTTKGQVVIPAKLRQEFEIKEGTRAAVIATDEGILLKPITRANKSKPETVSDLEEEFNGLASQWKRETSFLSSLSDKFTHPAYQRIVAMGEKALPWILKDLQAQPGHWFYALKFIAGKDIAAEVGAKTFSEARDAWLQWGKKYVNAKQTKRLLVGTGMFQQH